VRRVLSDWLADRFGSGTPADADGQDTARHEPARLYTCAGCEKTLVAFRLDACPGCDGAVERTRTGRDLGHVPTAD
jgi:hypothetical protein